MIIVFFRNKEDVVNHIVKNDLITVNFNMNPYGERIIKYPNFISMGLGYTDKLNLEQYLELAGKITVHVISDNLYNQLNCSMKNVKTGDCSEISESIENWRKHTSDIYYMEAVDVFVKNTMPIQRKMKEMRIGKLELICAREKEQYDNIFEICNNISEDSNQFALLTEIVFFDKRRYTTLYNYVG